MTNRTITAPRGFLAAGVKCGIKISGKPDMALLVCPTGATAAAVFTTNKITSAAVEVSREHARSAKVYAVVVNSGCANACTGKLGLANARKMCELTAAEVGIEPDQVLVASTGVIGHQLPMDKVTDGITRAAAALSDSPRAGLAFAHAIMTTDTKCKQAFRQITLSRKPVRIAGTVKGAGMIGPNMATTLLFVTTDVAISKPLLNKAFTDAVGSSLNRLTVDGHQSTNDTGVLLASGQAGNPRITNRSRDYERFSAALTDLCTDLVRQMALDAEGASRMFRVVIKGAATQADAVKAARAIADYPLFKCAVHRRRPELGVASSAPSAPRAWHSTLVGSPASWTTSTCSEKGRRPTSTSRRRPASSRSESTPSPWTWASDGAGDFYYGCDLSAEYVHINADYHT
jgi:glutamate N-acetyltransferase/amino-acid N-acetyltransferase